MIIRFAYYVFLAVFVDFFPRSVSHPCSKREFRMRETVENILRDVVAVVSGQHHHATVCRLTPVSDHILGPLIACLGRIRKQVDGFVVCSAQLPLTEQTVCVPVASFANVARFKDDCCFQALRIATGFRAS